MVKSLKVFSVLFAIAWAGLVFLLVMTSLRQPDFGKLVVDAYEELTNSFGHTVAGMYNRLAGYLMWAAVGLTSATVVVFAAHAKAIKSIVFDIEGLTADEEAEVKNVEEAAKSAKEKKLARVREKAEKLANEIKKEEQRLAVEKTIEASKEVIHASKDAASAFLDGLKAFKK